MPTALSLICGIAAVFSIGLFAGTRLRDFSDYPSPVPSMAFGAVLDGDTIIDRGRSIHIEGLDAPELGPWAHCWSEAALAGIPKPIWKPYFLKTEAGTL